MTCIDNKDDEMFCKVNKKILYRNQEVFNISCEVNLSVIPKND